MSKEAEQIALKLYRIYSYLHTNGTVGGWDAEPEEVKNSYRNEASQIMGLMHELGYRRPAELKLISDEEIGGYFRETPNNLEAGRCIAATQLHTDQQALGKEREAHG